ncbi:MAG: pectate lyase [Acidobacteriaceae bacterium]
MPPRTVAALCLAASLLATHVPAEIVGTSVPADSLTRARINATLSLHERQPWLDFLDRSDRQRAADHAALAAERKGLATLPALPASSSSAHSVPVDRDPTWYRTPEALHIADTVVSFQTPAGGWSKNLDFSGLPRARGQSYAPDNASRHSGPADFDAPAEPAWNYIGTLDNDATTTQLRFLAQICSQLPEREAARYRKAFLRGIQYLLNAQYPDGGWPQVWPLEGGYHDAITYNDNAVTQAAAVLTQIAAHRFPWVCQEDRDLCAHAATAVSRTVELILATQIRVDGHLTAWAQQHDPLTLAPVAGRNYEPAALSTVESANLMLYLMSMPDPSPSVRTAIDSAAAWLQSVAIHGYTWSHDRDDPAGRLLKASADAALIWPRYLSISTGKPIFGDRDKTIHDTVTELSPERRNGYAWYSSSPQSALNAYVRWRAQYPR